MGTQRFASSQPPSDLYTDMPVAPEFDFQRTPATLLVIGVAAALEVVSLINPALRDAYYNKYLGILPFIWDGQIWRPFTTTLLHGGPIHALFNAYWFLIFGTALERRFGSPRFLGLVVLLAYVTTLPQYVVTNYSTPLDAQVGVVGLSGVLYGLFGILLIGRRYEYVLGMVCDRQTVELLIGWFFVCIVATHFGLLPVANIAHGAGIVFGVLYGLVAFDRRRRWRWLALAAVASLVVLATLVYCPGHAGYDHFRPLRSLRGRG